MEKKPILIQGAMEAEVAQIKEYMEEIEEVELNGYIFNKGIIDNYPIVLSKTQVGLMNVTAATVTAMFNFSPCIIINQGVAGGITKNVHKGDIILGENCININSFQTPYKDEKEGSNSLDWELKTFKEGIDELVELKADKDLLDIAKEQVKKPKWILVSWDRYFTNEDASFILSNYELYCEFSHDRQYLEKPKIGQVFQVYLYRRKD